MQKPSLASTHACGRAGRDYVAGQQGDRAREPRDEVGWSEDQVGGRALLLYLAVDSCAQPERSQVADLIEIHQRRSAGRKGVDRLPARPQRILELEVAGGHVVEWHRPSDVGQRVL